MIKEEALNKNELEDFRNVYNDLDSVYAVFPKICGLSDTEYWALVMVYEGVTTQRDICEQLSLSRQTVNSAFSQLVKKGLVCLKPVENNMRTKKVVLTNDGICFVEKHIGIMHKLEERVWHMMEIEEREQLVHLLHKYKELMREALENHKATE
jgi:DNA-binding MarR family transcriptional regulator